MTNLKKFLKNFNFPIDNTCNIEYNKDTPKGETNSDLRLYSKRKEELLMKQFEVFEAARKTMMKKLGISDLTFQLGCAEYGDYIEVVDPDTNEKILVPVTVKVASHRYKDTEGKPAYNLEDEADCYEEEIAAKEEAVKAKAADKKRKEDEKARVKAQKEAVKLAKKLKKS